MDEEETMLLKSPGAENLRMLALKHIQSEAYLKRRPVTYTLNGDRLYIEIQLFCLSTFRQTQTFLHHCTNPAVTTPEGTLLVRKAVIYSTFEAYKKVNGAVNKAGPH